MIYQYDKILLSSLLLFFSMLFGQECDPGFVWIEEVPTCCGAPTQHCFFETDLNILWEMIDNSSESINMLHDENENGIIEPLELGYTEWIGGRIVALDCFLSDIMNCNLSGPLPENFGDLEYIEALWLNGNQFSNEIPESMGNLANLELLYLSDNQFSGNIPESLCNLDIDWSGTNNWGVEYFNIWGNAICPPYPDCMNVDIVGEQDMTECVAVGDVNSDGTLNILDIVIIANIILGSAENTPEADVNYDGDVNIIDIVILANIILTQ